jgi:transposase
MSRMRSYTQEFRESAIELVLSGSRSIRAAAADLGIPFYTLQGWVRQRRRSAADPADRAARRKPPTDAEARVRELEAEVRRLTIERDILKKAAAYFARDQS